MSSFVNRTLIVTLALVSFSCAQAPNDQIAAAKAAVEAARAFEPYAPDAFKQAEDTLNTAMAEVEAQGGKFGFMRSYDQSKNLLSTAESAAAKAKAEGEARREAVKLEAQTLIQEAQGSLSAAQTALATAPRGKGTEADLAAMKADLEAMSTTVAEAETALAGGDFLGARAKAESVKTGAAQIAADIEQAKAKKSRR
jgi:hypothetical protein